MSFERAGRRRRGPGRPYRLDCPRDKIPENAKGDTGTIIEGKYEILGKIRDSEAGGIYKVRHIHLDEIRIVKVMRPQGAAGEEQGRRFLQEAKTLTRLKHPNICAILDLFQDRQGTAYIVLEYIDGVTMSELLEASGPPSLPLALEIAHQTLIALECLHRRNIVHRDIAPDNIMLTIDENQQPHVKLIGLGVAKMLTEAVELTPSGGFVGKMKYSSPEQLGALEEGEKIDGRSDLYSLGVVLYQMLTGILPIREDQPRHILVGHLFLPPIPFVKSDPEGKVPQEVAEMTLKALEKRREKRFSSAEEFDKELVSLKDRVARPADSDTTRPLTIGEAWQARSSAPVISPDSAASKRKANAPTAQAAAPLPAAPEPAQPVPEDPTLVVKQAAPAKPVEAPAKAATIPPPPVTPRPPQLRRRAVGGATAAGILVGALVLLLFLRSKAETRSKPAAPASPSLAPVTVLSAEPKITAAPEVPSPPAPEAPTPASVPGVTAAEEARSRAAAARSAAEKEDATARAPNTYRRARQTEAEAQGLFARQEYSLAEPAFVAAENLFQRARDSSVQLKREAESARRQMSSPNLTPIGPAPAAAPPEPKPVATPAPIIVQAPVLVREVGPDYPASDTLPPGPGEIVIVVDAVVTEKGDVHDAQIPNAQYLVLDRAATDAVSNWHFRPATVNGNPVAVRIRVTSVVRRTRNLLGNRLKQVSRSIETTGLATPVPSQAAE